MNREAAGAARSASRSPNAAVTRDSVEHGLEQFHIEWVRRVVADDLRADVHEGSRAPHTTAEAAKPQLAHLGGHHYTPYAGGTGNSGPVTGIVRAGTGKF